MSNWRSTIIVSCAVISVVTLFVYFLVLWPQRAPLVRAATYATNTDLAYYIRSVEYTFYLSQDKQSLEIKDAKGSSVNLKLGGDVRSQGLKIENWKLQSAGNILPPLDCEFIQIRTYPGLFHTELSTSVSSIDCKQHIDSDVIQSLE